MTLAPAYQEIGKDWFFTHVYGVPEPEEIRALAAPVLLAAVRPAATGRRARALGSERIPGGIRATIAIAVDPGPPAWGPRAGTDLDVLVFEGAGARNEWVIELE